MNKKKTTDKNQKPSDNKDFDKLFEHKARITLKNMIDQKNWGKKD